MAQARRAMTRNKRILMIVLIVFFSLLLIAVGIVLFIMAKWRAADQMSVDMFQPENQLEVTLDRDTVQTTVSDQPVIVYNGKSYVFNSELISILFMGIDTTDEEAYAYIGMTAHQSDTLILAVVNPESRELTMINIPRNSITDVKQYDINMKYAFTSRSPICIQHAFGDGKALSCELTVEATSNLLFNVPIGRYIQMNLDGMVKANDAMGGITLELLDDFTAYNKSMIKGATYTLKGQDAMQYIRGRRMEGLDGTSLTRMNRQTQYYKAFFAAAKTKLRADPSFVLNLYLDMQSSVNTNLSIDEILYLSKLMLSTNIDEDRVFSLEGTVDPETDFFYVDDDALRALLIEVFYQEVS